MARITRRYSDYYSKLYRHVGRIYQRRYYAKAVEDPHVLLIVSRYIHRNAIETVVPMVTDLVHYPHSSFPSYLQPDRALLPYLNPSVLPELLAAPFLTDEEGYCQYCLTEVETDEEVIEEWMGEMV